MSKCFSRLMLSRGGSSEYLLVLLLRVATDLCTFGTQFEALTCRLVVVDSMGHAFLAALDITEWGLSV